MHAALLKTKAEGIFLLAADLPFANPEAALFIMRLGKGRDACVIKTDDGYCEPLFGYYARSMLPRAQEALAAGVYAMTTLYRKADVRFIGPAELGDLWRANMLRNVNAPEDYEKALAERTRDKGRST